MLSGRSIRVQLLRALKVSACLAGSIPVLSLAQVDALYDQGSSALIRQLERLQTTASVLHTGAHPDDEDSALVAYHARRTNARTAYISLTRGSGGQNIIGAEQSDALGVIRTEELLQARRLDGATQYFTRANDFGFSKYRTEVSRVWPEEDLLSDMVRTIRQFRPDVVVSRWNGTPDDGHGHHQFAGYLTPIAVDAAADPGRFPEQVEAGFPPWQVQKLYTSFRSFSSGEELSLLQIDTGEYDPVTGKSYFEIGMQGRSQQKTQQMGSLELRGRQASTLQLLKSEQASNRDENSVFDGIDTSVSGIARHEPAPSRAFTNALTALEEANNRMLGSFDPRTPADLLPQLARSHALALAARDLATSEEAQRLLNEKITETETAIVLAAGVRTDALIDREKLVPASSATIAARVFIPGEADVEFLRAQVSAPDGWLVQPSNTRALPDETGRRRVEVADQQSFFNVSIPADAVITQPYWLKQARQGAAYDWSAAGAAQTLPFEEPVLKVLTQLRIAGVELTIEREVEYRQLDRIRGEVRRRVDVVPAVTVAPATDLLVVPVNSQTRSFPLQLTVQNQGVEVIEGRARFTAPAGWDLEPASLDFSMPPGPAAQTLEFQVTLPDDVSAGDYRLQASASVAGVTFTKAMQEIRYPHIRTHRLYSHAEIEFEVVDVEVADVRVGYVMGSGDQVPEALRRLGVSVVLLSDADLTTGDLGQFDTIVVGIRASQTRDAYVTNNQRLLEFAEQGGALIVQYQQPDFAVKGLAPFDVAMERNIRVVDENAPITLLEPDHPVFTFPNQIDGSDFDGWVQERNNYNFTGFDRERYLPLTEAHDDGEPPSDGAMLYARLGSGHYLYTSYSWFRQLPNGVPGAYRLFANMLSLPEAPQ